MFKIKYLSSVLFISSFLFISGCHKNQSPIEVVQNQQFADVESKKDSLSGQDVFKEIKGFSDYTATIVGYGMFCDYSNNEIEAIKNNLIKSLDNIKLSNNDYQEIQNSFLETVKIAKSRGPANSNLTCLTFKPEFEKIYNSIK